MGKTEFTTEEIRAYEQSMRAVYPQNLHVREKVRQQLQILTALGYLERVARGEYRVLR